MKNFLLTLVLSAYSMPALAQKVVPWELLAVPYSTTPDGLYCPAISFVFRPL